MEKIEISIYTCLNNIEDTYKILAIKDNDVIKYNDLENNKIVIDMHNNIMERENSDYHFTLDFFNNNIIIKLKKENKIFNKDIETLLIDKNKKYYVIKYKLSDENIINEYQINF